MDDTVWQAWQKVEDKKPWRGNLDILKYEQEFVLQPKMYDDSKTLFWIADTDIRLWFVDNPFKSPVPGHEETFPGNNIANFDERWKWVESGVTGISVECALDVSISELTKGIPHGQIGVTTVAKVRQIGGDVIRTSGRSPYHATLTGLSAAQMSNLLTPTTSNPNRSNNLPRRKL